MGMSLLTLDFCSLQFALLIGIFQFGVSFGFAEVVSEINFLGLRCQTSRAGVVGREPSSPLGRASVARALVALLDL